jgi:predicted alpha/beta superfamily hydrolase
MQQQAAEAFRTFEEAGFEDWQQVLPPGWHTIHGTVKIHPTMPMPQLGVERRVWLRLPSSYFHSTRDYPIIIFQDGQNLFDEATSFKGQEWRVDETLLALEGRGLEAIAVGIDNGGHTRRGMEYHPFLADTLLPHVSRACEGRVRAERDSTAVIGSSWGALISLYTFFRRPDVFGICGAMSTSTSERMLRFIEQQPFPGGRVWIDHGQDAQSMSLRLIAVLRAMGYDLGTNLDYYYDDGEHEELAWAWRLPAALQFLMLESAPAYAPMR